MIRYYTSADGITEDQLGGGFFVGWPNPPTPAAHCRIVRQSAYVVLALSEDDHVVGYITAISDHVSCAYIPHLEVLPAYQGQGIGRQLVRRMLAQLEHLYMLDLVCDANIAPFYQHLGFQPVVGMVWRNYQRQSCDPLPEG